MKPIKPEEHDQVLPTRIIDTRKGVASIIEMRDRLIEDHGIKAVLGTMAPNNHEPCVVLVTGDNCWIVMDVEMATKYASLYRVVFDKEPEDIELMQAVDRVIASMRLKMPKGPETLQ